jgi:hypothetical protein
MTGLRVDFGPDGISFRPDTVVSGKQAEVQNALINIATIAGTDVTYPEKGTHLLKTLARTGAPTPMRAQHIATFAAVDTLFFCRGADREDTGDSLEEVELFLEYFQLQHIELSAKLKFVDKTEIGVHFPIPTVTS